MCSWRNTTPRGRFMDNKKVIIIQDEISKVTGPIAKFVVSKQIRDLDQLEEEFPDELLDELIHSSLIAGVFDRTLHEDMRKRIWKSIERLEEEEG